MADGTGGSVQVGHAILNTTVSPTTKKLSAQIGDVRGEVDSDNCDYVQQPGFVSRPPKAEPGKAAAYAVIVRGGDRDTIIGSIDHRGLELYGNLGFGETGLYAAGEDGNAQARLLLKKDGSVNLFTKEGNTKDGKGITFSIRADGSVDLATSKGVALQMGVDASTKLFTPNGSLEINAAGAVKIAASKKVSISGTSVALGGGPQSAAVVTATELIAFGQALVAALNLITPAGGGAPAATAVQTAVTALTAALQAKRTTAD